VLHAFRRADAKAFKTEIDFPPPPLLVVLHASRRADAKAFGTEINDDLSPPSVVGVLTP